MTTALLALAKLGEAGLPLRPLAARIDAVLGELLPTPNVFLALIDETERRIRFVYTKDRHDRHNDRPIDGLGLTDRVYLSGRSLLLKRAQTNELLASGEMVNHGVPSQVWLGVPLKCADRVVGVWAVQDYDSPMNLGERDEAVLNRVAPIIGCLIQGAVERARRESEAERAGRRRRELGGLFATLGHEVRSPLSVVVGYADLLRQQLEAGDSRSTAEKVFGAAQELADATTRMLDYAAIESGVGSIVPTAIDLGDWLSHFESWVAGRPDMAGIEFRAELVNAVVERASIDGNLLRQLLQHLLRVAGAQVQVRRVGLRVRVQPVVTMPAGRLRLAFSVGATADEAGPIEKLGSGDLTRVETDMARPMTRTESSLAMAVRIAEMLGAELRVSPTGRVRWRASLVLTVPTAPGFEANEIETIDRTLGVLRHHLQERASSVVVFDGDALSRVALGAILRESTGVEPVAVATVEALREHVRNGVVSVVIASFETEVARAVATVGAAVGGGVSGRVRPYLIAVSSWQQPDKVEAMLDAGADAYLPQPLNRAALLVALSDAWIDYERRSELAGD